MNARRSILRFLLTGLLLLTAACAGSGRSPATREGLFGRPEGGRALPPLTQKGIDEYRRGDLATAQELFERSLGLYPDNAEAYYYLAEIRYRQRDYDESLALLDKAEIYFGPNKPWLGRVYLLMGKNDEARGRLHDAAARYREALSLDPGNGDAARRLARLSP